VDLWEELVDPVGGSGRKTPDVSRVVQLQANDPKLAIGPQRYTARDAGGSLLAGGEFVQKDGKAEFHLARHADATTVVVHGHRVAFFRNLQERAQAGDAHRNLGIDAGAFAESFEVLHGTLHCGGMTEF